MSIFAAAIGRNFLRIRRYVAHGREEVREQSDASGRHCIPTCRHRRSRRQAKASPCGTKLRNFRGGRSLRMRNILIHDYLSISLGLVWNTAITKTGLVRKCRKSDSSLVHRNRLSFRPRFTSIGMHDLSPRPIHRFSTAPRGSGKRQPRQSYFAPASWQGEMAEDDVLAVRDPGNDPHRANWFAVIFARS